MISKFFKIIFIIISFFFANQANSKNIDYNFNKSELSNYLSAIISFNNHENEQEVNQDIPSLGLILMEITYPMLRGICCHHGYRRAIP